MCFAALLPNGKVLTQSLSTTDSDNRPNRYARAEQRGGTGTAAFSPLVFVVVLFWSLQICYGIIYGMGAKSLGEQMGVEEDDAACYIESFKARYKGKRCF